MTVGYLVCSCNVAFVFCCFFFSKCHKMKAFRDARELALCGTFSNPKKLIVSCLDTFICNIFFHRDSLHVGLLHLFWCWRARYVLFMWFFHALVVMSTQTSSLHKCSLSPSLNFFLSHFSASRNLGTHVYLLAHGKVSH